MTTVFNIFQGNKKLEKTNFITILKAHDLLLYGNLEIQDLEIINKSLNVNNVATFYQIAKYFNLTKLSKLALCYTERCFTVVCETQNYLELDYTSVANILSSSNLQLDSELEALKAADDWVRYNYDERSKFAKYLLLKIRLPNILLKARLPLISEYILNSLLDKMCFNEIDACVKILKEFSQDHIKRAYLNKSRDFYSSRFCSHDAFKIVVNGGNKYNETGQEILVNRTQQVDCKTFEVVQSLATMNFKGYDRKTVYCRGEVYVFGGYESEFHHIKHVDKYSLITKTRKRVADMFDNRDGFCACAFTDQIFIIGGWSETENCYVTTCKKLHTNTTNGKKRRQ